MSEKKAEESPYEYGKRHFKSRLDWIKSHPVDQAMAESYTRCDRYFKAKDEQDACAKGVYDGYLESEVKSPRKEEKKEYERKMEE